jgi:dipeptidyl aminopeptidase/acylaminoacyl peptidase
MSKLKLEEKYESQGWPSVARPDLWPPDGWDRLLLSAVDRIRNHQLSPDGRQIACIIDRAGLSDVYLVPVSGGWPRRLSFDRPAVAYWSDEVPQWSPDGQWLAFSMHDHVYRVPAAGGVPKKLTDFASAAAEPIWMPDNQGLIVSVDRRGRSPEASEEATQLLLTDLDGGWPKPLVTNQNGDCWEARPSPDGRFVCFTFRPFNDLQRTDIWLVEVASCQIRELTAWPGVRSWHGRWSPDGQQIAFLSQQTGWTEIWLARPDGQEPHQLTHLGIEIVELAWSPGGDRLAAVLNRQGAYTLGLVDVASGSVSDLRTDEGVVTRPCWSPDGDWLTVEYEDPRQPPDLYRVGLDGRRRQLTFSNPPALAANKLVRPERVSYSSYDGLEIPAFLYRPEKPNGAAVVYPHGGPSAQYVLEWDIMVQYFVAKGYTWLCPNYRGSTGYGVTFEHANYGDWGNGDTQDCLHGARFLITQPAIDGDRLAILGSSYGGYMVACCLSRDPDYLFACGVDKFGDANVLTSWAQCNRHLRLYSEIFLGHPARNRPAYKAGSPIYQVENIRRPLLILHGLDDDVVPPEASEELVQALRRAGKTFEYKTYAGEPHGFLQRATQQDAFERIERFLDWYLLP